MRKSLGKKVDNWLK